MAETKGNRTWLNTEKSSLASIGWSIDEGYANLEIRDCSRSVNLDFHFGRTASKRKKCIDKLDKIAAMVAELRKEISGEDV